MPWINYYDNKKDHNEFGEHYVMWEAWHDVWNCVWLLQVAILRINDQLSLSCWVVFGLLQNSGLCNLSSWDLWVTSPAPEGFSLVVTGIPVLAHWAVIAMFSLGLCFFVCVCAYGLLLTNTLCGMIYYRVKEALGRWWTLLYSCVRFVIIHLCSMK